MHCPEQDSVVKIPCGEKFGRPAGAVFIVYSPFSGNAQLITEDLLPRLESAIAGKCDDPQMKTVANHLLGTGKDREIPDPAPDAGHISTLVLIPSFECNFHCSYCYAEKTRGSGFLSREQVETVLRHFVTAERNERKKLRIVFLGGGEPLLASDMIGFSCETALGLAGPQGIGIYFSLITNGSLITDETVAMILKYDIHTAVSFEILEDIQNAQRGHFEEVLRGIRKLTDGHCACRLNSIITERNIDRMPEMVRELHEKLPAVSKVSFELATQPDVWGTPELLRERLEKFRKNFKQAQSAAESFGIKLSNSMFDCVDLCHTRFCPGEFVATPDGCITVCHRVTHRSDDGFEQFCCGRFADGEVEVFSERAGALLGKNVFAYPECKTCPARWNCAGFCLVKRSVYAPEALAVICETMRTILREELFERIEKSMKDAGVDVYGLFAGK